MTELPTDAVHQGARENSLVVTALRSAFKELGLLPTNIEVRVPTRVVLQAGRGRPFREPCGCASVVLPTLRLAGAEDCLPPPRDSLTTVAV